MIVIPIGGMTAMQMIRLFEPPVARISGASRVYLQ
jgi:hypothetical protein